MDRFGFPTIAALPAIHFFHTGTLQAVGAQRLWKWTIQLSQMQA